MDIQAIVVSSITYAFRGVDILKKHNIKAYIERTPKKLDIKGCSYSIYVKGDINKARQILINEKIRLSPLDKDFR